MNRFIAASIATCVGTFLGMRNILPQKIVNVSHGNNKLIVSCDDKRYDCDHINVQPLYLFTRLNMHNSDGITRLISFRGFNFRHL